jgi:hypothetical protein
MLTAEATLIESRVAPHSAYELVPPCSALATLIVVLYLYRHSIQYIPARPQRNLHFTASQRLVLATLLGTRPRTDPVDHAVSAGAHDHPAPGPAERAERRDGLYVL